MPLSLKKLQNLLSNKGLLPKKYFTIRDMCVYIELLNIYSADSIMLYIPSKYNILADNNKDIYKMEYLDIDENGNISHDYAGEPDNHDLDNDYEEIDIDNDINKKNFENNLTEKYNHPLSLKDIKKNDTNNIREIFRQLKRLKFCVQNLKYKICIMYKDFLCCLRRDNTLEGYLVQNLRGPPDHKLVITIDLVSFYEKIEYISVDTKTIREGIYKILNKNQEKHITNLQKMLDVKNNLSLYSQQVINKKNKYTNHLIDLELLFNNIISAEQNILEKLLNTKNKYNTSSGIKGIHNDIEHSHNMSRYESELSKINVIKQDIITNILNTKSKLENLSLKMDYISFDNSVMIDAIIKNFNRLSQL